NQIGHLEDLPAELQAVIFERHLPALAQRHVPAGVAISAEGIARTVALAGERVIEVVDRRGWVGEHADRAIPLLEGAGLWPGGDLRQALEIPVRGPELAVVHAEGESGGPAREPGELPAADDSIRECAGAVGTALA